MPVNGYLTEEEIRVKALDFARMLERPATRQGVTVSISPTVDELIADAKKIEAYITDEDAE